MSTQIRPEASHTGGNKDQGMVDEAKDKGQSMVDEAKEKGQEIGREAKHEFDNVISELKDQTRDEADSQTRRTADAIRGWSRQMHSMAESSDEKGRAVDLTRAGAEQIDRIADRLENDGLEGIIHDVEGFARRRPGLFLAAGVGVGVAMGRLFRVADTSALKDAVTGESSDSTSDRSPQSGQSSDFGSARSRGIGQTPMAPSGNPTAADRPMTDPGFTTGDPRR